MQLYRFWETERNLTEYVIVLYVCSMYVQDGHFSVGSASSVYKCVFLSLLITLCSSDNEYKLCFFLACCYVIAMDFILDNGS